ncbi:hypothetical protein DXT99_05245 [Pontibacter diazotrophicus]|uniref:Glycosyltransferase RgtA/B/C/D-like domain-containing protein n=1 Tax=Pontibacter diazotrophicus TaxID=1400979 RepID=A0A3D8LFA2_9BACT|nr:hypothetical protein [Pontibacter diazotrophicus]RDV16077.1 hypothetical protein DXT99_05245 [Pontibacter diazotrophicus]
MSILVYVLNFLLLGGLVWWMQRQEWLEELKPYFYPALMLKLVCGIMLGVLYFYYYGEGDTTFYHKRALWAVDILYHDGLQDYLKYLLVDEVPQHSPLSAVQVPYYSSAWNVVKLISVPLAFTAGSYYLCSVYLSLLSFAGVWFLVNKLSNYFPGTAKAAVISFLFIPSVVFWSSGIIKESFIMGGMGMLVGSCLELLQPGTTRVKIKYMLLALVGVLLIWYVKYFVAIALGFFLLSVFVLKILNTAKALEGISVYLKVVAAVLLFIGIAFVSSRLNYNLNFSQMPVTVYNNYLEYRLISEEKPSINLPTLEPTYFSFVIHAPLAFFNILLRPFLWEVYNPVTFVAAIENTFVLILLLLFCWDAFRNKIRFSSNNYLLPATVCYILLMGILLAYSMPNFGTLSRYRIVFLPFLLYLLFLSPSTNRLLLHFRFKKKI